PRRGLGRGLGALIPAADESASAVQANATYLEVDPNDIVPNPRQPRQVFDEDAMAELVFSVREIGLLQPIVVRRREDGPPFELIAGERR
ncbi:MAG: ParB N-terminal domain-containing protein, partial [Candidatus Nanopelagicales bacterium]